MKRAINMLSHMINTKQCKLNIKILELLSQYRSITGHELPKHTICQNLHITSQKYNLIMAGSTEIPLKVYNKIIVYLKNIIDYLRNSVHS